MARHFCMNIGRTSMFTLHKKSTFTFYLSEVKIILYFYISQHSRAWSVCLVKTSNLPEKCPTTDTCLQACWVIFVFLLITIKFNKILTVSSCISWRPSESVSGDFKEFQLTLMFYLQCKSEIHWNCLKLIQNTIKKCKKTLEVFCWILLRWELKSDCSKLTI